MAPQPGDFVVVRTNGFVGWAIRVVTRSKYNHAAVFVSETEIVEAKPQGAVRSVFDYSVALYSSGRIILTDEQRTKIVANAVGLIGVPYNFLDIVSVGLLQYGIKPRWLRNRVEHTHNLICSQLVDFAYLLSGVHLFVDGRLPMDCTPGDLARLVS